MHIIKFIYQTFILPPGIFIVSLALLSVWSLHKAGRIGIILSVITLVFYLSSIRLVSETLIRPLEYRYSPPEKVQGDVIIMLGGGATLDSPNIGGYGHLLGSSANRLLTTAQLYNKLKVPIIVSGGQVYDHTGSEADIAKDILIGLGVPSDMIIPENRSLNTSQNAKYTKEIIEQNNFKDPILVTSAFHMLRSVEQFEKVGVSVTPFPTDYFTSPKARVDIFSIVPSALYLKQTGIALKEYIGHLALKLFGY